MPLQRVASIILSNTSPMVTSYLYAYTRGRISSRAYHRVASLYPCALLPQMKVLPNKMRSIYIGQLLNGKVVEISRHLALIAYVLGCALCVV